jgi:hypothetical protein
VAGPGRRKARRDAGRKRRVVASGMIERLTGSAKTSFDRSASCRRSSILARRSVFYSGLDWSGNPGDPRKPGMSDQLVIGLAQIDGAELPRLSQVLAAIRDDCGLDGRFSFKHSACSDRVRTAFFSQIFAVAVTTRLVCIDKRTWYEPRRPGRPSDWLDEAIADVICGSPRHTIVGQVILIDRPKHEMKAV